MNKVGYDLCDGIKKGEENVTENYSASWNALLDEGDDEHRRTEVSQMDSEFCVIIIDLHNTSTSYFLFFLFSDLMSIIPWKGIILVKQKYIFKNTLFFLDPKKNKIEKKIKTLFYDICLQFTFIQFRITRKNIKEAKNNNDSTYMSK